MVLDVPFDFSEGPPLGGRLDWSEHEKWLKQASSGDEYPFQQIDTRMKLNFRQRRGGVISKRIPNGEAYARVASEAADIVKGEDAKHLLEACKRLQARGLFSSQFAINSMNDAVFRNGGKLLFLSHLESGLEFPASPHE
jgi:hypothetical protein